MLPYLTTLIHHETFSFTSGQHLLFVNFFFFFVEWVQQLKRWKSESYVMPRERQINLMLTIASNITYLVKIFPSNNTVHNVFWPVSKYRPCWKSLVQPMNTLSRFLGNYFFFKKCLFLCNFCHKSHCLVGLYPRHVTKQVLEIHLSKFLTPHPHHWK